MAAATVLILAVDAERILRRVTEGPTRSGIEISIERSLNEDMNEYAPSVSMTSMTPSAWARAISTIIEFRE
jgi:hypothetical protein